MIMLQSKYLSMLQEIRDDPGQNEAIERDDDKHCIVIAGPGTGKTRTLVFKAAKLLNETIHPPRGLACVTYAHAMAEELRQRLFELGIYKRHNVFIGTLHGFSLSNILIPFGRLYNYPLPNPLKVASDKQQAEVYRKIWDTLKFSNNIRAFKPERNRIDNSFADRLPITFQKYRRTQLDSIQSPRANSYVEKLLKIYETTLLSNGFTDFDLQIKWAMKLVEEESYVRDSLAAKYPWLLIDEYQDLGLPLHRMVLSLTANTNMKLFAIGDPNQCIYDFSGASPAYLYELEMSNDRYGEPIYLTKNYRSLQKIVDASSIIIPTHVEFEAVRQDSIGYVGCIVGSVSDIIRRLRQDINLSYHQIMVLHRSRFGCRNVIMEIEQEAPEIPCFKAADQAYDSRKPLIEWLEKSVMYSVSDNPDEVNFLELCEFWRTLLISQGLSRENASSFKHRVNLFIALSEAKKYRDSAFSWLKSFDEAINLEYLLRKYGLLRPDDLEEYEHLQDVLKPDSQLANYSLEDMRERIQQRDRVFIGTLHSSKGQEREAIIIVGAESLNARDTERQEQNKRLFYVGITRAKDWLFVLHNGKSYLGNQLRDLN